RALHAARHEDRARDLGREELADEVEDARVLVWRVCAKRIEVREHGLALVQPAVPSERAHRLIDRCAIVREAPTIELRDAHGGFGRGSAEECSAPEAGRAGDDNE